MTQKDIKRNKFSCFSILPNHSMASSSFRLPLSRFFFLFMINHRSISTLYGRKGKIPPDVSPFLLRVKNVTTFSATLLSDVTDLTAKLDGEKCSSAEFVQLFHSSAGLFGCRVKCKTVKQLHNPATISRHLLNAEPTSKSHYSPARHRHVQAPRDS